MTITQADNIRCGCSTRSIRYENKIEKATVNEWAKWYVVISTCCKNKGLNIMTQIYTIVRGATRIATVESQASVDIQGNEWRLYNKFSLSTWKIWTHTYNGLTKLHITININVITSWKNTVKQGYGNLYSE